jgi:hypothetical protein
MKECIICKIDKHQKQTWCQFLCCIPKHKQNLIKCNRDLCFVYYHSDCLISEILQKKDLKSKQLSTIEPYDCLDCHKQLTIVKVPYENYEDYHNKTKTNRMIKSWLFKHIYMILYGLLFVLFIVFDVLYSIKASIIVSDYIKSVNKINHRFTYPPQFALNILIFIICIGVTCIGCCTNTYDIYKEIKLYILILIYMLVKVGVSTWFTIILYKICDVITSNDIKYLYINSNINIIITFMYTILIPIIVTLINPIIYCILMPIYKLLEYCRQYRQTLKTQNIRTIKILDI